MLAYSVSIPLNNANQITAQKKNSNSVVKQTAKTLVVFSDDWGRHPSSCQHLVRRLLIDHQVIWVNTIGTRSPKLDWATVSRGFGKLWQWLGKRRSATSSTDSPAELQPQVLSPIMWPWFRTSMDRRINRWLLTRAINRTLGDRDRRRVAITTLPLTADVAETLDVDAWVYYCVDDLASWPGLDAKPLQEMEIELLAKVDSVISVSVNLQNRLNSLGRSSTLISHGVDLEHWSNNTAHPEVDQTLQTTAGSLIVFWGLIDDRLEVDWVRTLADRLNEETIVLAGPIESLPSDLKNHPRVLTTGALPYDALPGLANRASVLVMPYRDITATRAMQPLKLKEYLTTGLPCVVRSLPATVPWANSLDLVTTQNEFVDAVIYRLATGLPVGHAVDRERLVEESWDAKANSLRGVIESLASGSNGE